MLSIKLILLTLCLSYPSAQELDILDFAAKHSLNKSVQQPDGSWRIPKFGDDLLEQAVANLKAYPRPWTVSKLLIWYRQAKGDQTRSLLLRVLAASRDPRAAIALGEALGDEWLEIRTAATYGLLDYFIGGGINGGTEQHMKAVQDWWEMNREKLQREAARMSANKGT